jgi:hypothetical protein
MDEPTAALSAEEVRRVFQVVARLRAKELPSCLYRIVSRKSSRSRSESP